MAAESKKKEVVETEERKQDRIRFEEIFGRPDFQAELSEHWKEAVTDLKSQSFSSIEDAQEAIVQTVCARLGIEEGEQISEFVKTLLDEPQVSAILKEELGID